MKYTKKNKQKGGLGLLKNNNDFKQAFGYFIHNCEVKFLSAGSSGIIFKCKFKESDTMKTPYNSFRAKDFGVPVNEIILKIVLLNSHIKDDNTNSDDFNFSYQIDIMNSKNANQERPKFFVREVNNQIKVSLETMKYLEPSSPIIVYSTLFDNTNSIEFIKLIRSKYAYGDRRMFDNFDFHLNKQYMNHRTQTLYPNKSFIGVIAMEMVSSNFTTLYNFYSSKIELDREFNYLKADFQLEKKKYDEYTGKYKYYLNRGDRFEEEARESKNLLDKHEADLDIIVNKIDEKLLDFERRNNFELIKNMARFTYLNIAAITGISQSDYHFGNFLYDPIFKGYFNANPPPVVDVDSNIIHTDIGELVINNETKKTVSYQDDDDLMDVSIMGPKEDDLMDVSIMGPKDDDNYSTKSSNIPSTPDVSPYQIKSPLNDTSIDYYSNMDMDNINVSVMNSDSDTSKSSLKGGAKYNIDKGRMLLIDYGYSNIIKPENQELLKRGMKFFYNKDLSKESKTILRELYQELLDIITMTPRNDNNDMLAFDDMYYHWFNGYYYCSMCHDLFDIYTQNGINNNDVDMFISLIQARKNSIDNLLYNAKKQNFPLTFPLTSDYIKEKVYSRELGLKGGGENKYDDLINKCFRTIGYGLKSYDELLITYDILQKNSSKLIMDKPYKMIDTVSPFLNTKMGKAYGGKKIKTRKNRSKKLNMTKRKTIKNKRKQ